MSQKVAERNVENSMVQMKIKKNTNMTKDADTRQNEMKFKSETTYHDPEEDTG